MVRPVSRFLPVLFLIAALFGFSPTHAVAVDVSVFGPQTVVKPQGPLVEQPFNFNMPVARGGFVRVDTTSSATITMTVAPHTSKDESGNGFVGSCPSRK